MGYLDNSSITVDAVLTKKGREILKNGGTLTTNSDGTQTLNPSSLNITSFTLSDTGVDYTLWNPTHPSGSDNYGEAIENLPQLEASVHAEYNLRNRLITLGQSATALPAIQISGLDSAGGTTLTFGTSDSETQGVATINVDILGLPDPSSDFYFTISDPNIVDAVGLKSDGILSATNRVYLPESGIASAKQYSFSGNSFQLKHIPQSIRGKSAEIYVTHKGSGAYTQFTATVNILKDETTLITTPRSGNV